MTKVLMVNSDLLARSRLAMPFDGKRDVYAQAGYSQIVTYQEYLFRYLRQDIARRIVNIYADETWRKSPGVLDGPDQATGKGDTEFALAWQRLATGGQADGAETRKGLLHYLHRVDRLSGIGTYGVLLFGLRDGKALAEPAEMGSAPGPESLLYINVFDEGAASVAQYVTDERDPRFGQPLLYRLTLRMGDSSIQRTAHWTRVLHVAEGVLTDDATGTPRLEACWNRLIDLDKVMAASGEAAWKLMDRGLVISTKDGYRLPAVTEDMLPGERETAEAEIAQQRAQIDEFVHGLRRALQLDGMDVQPIEGQLQDPTGTVDNIIRLIAAATGIPQRILVGSEAGELASSQDDENWADVIETRQTNYAGPAMLTPVINRLIWYGVLPAPSNGGFAVQWQPLTKKKKTEQAEVADTSASALQKVGAKVDPQAFVKAYLPDLPADAVSEQPPPPPPVAPVLPTDQAGDADTEGGQMATNQVASFRRQWANYP